MTEEKFLHSRLEEFVERWLKSYESLWKEWRHWLHQHPVLSGEEEPVIEWIQEQLQPVLQQNSRVPVDVVEPAPRTLAFTLGTSSHLRLGFRADVDALPLHENTKVPFASRVPGKMHACGHDVHTAGLMAFLVCWKDFLLEVGLEDFLESPEVMGWFQPSEERAPGGALFVVRSDWWKVHRPSCAFAVHVDPDLPLGHLGYHEGPFMASADEFIVQFSGTSVHATRQEHTKGSALRAALLFALSVEQAFYSWVPARIPRLIHVGVVQGGTAPNIVPAKAHVHGTFRLLEEEWRPVVAEKIVQLARAIAQTQEVEVEVHMPEGYPPVVNTPDLGRFLRPSLEQFSWFQNCIREVDIRLGADDFGWYTREVPSFYWRMGVRTAESPASGKPLHSPEFCPPDEAVAWIVRFWMSITWTFCTSLVPSFLRPPDQEDTDS